MSWGKESLTIRKSNKRPCCRCCDRSLPGDEDLVYLRSLRNRGQNIFFCFECINLMFYIVSDFERFGEDIR